MNRYVVDGVLADLAAGRRVLVVSQTVNQGRYAFDDIVSALQDAGRHDDVIVRRANGAQRIEDRRGGWVRFCSVASSARGMTADVVFIDADPTIEQLADLMPVVASTGGEVIRA